MRADGIAALGDRAAQDRSRSGTKAANLARLAANGFPVPPGFVVMVGAEGADEPAISAQLGEVGAERFAVRSSAVAEDLAGASFAGQYETELNVARAAVPAAVERVRASAANARVRAYRAARADPSPSDGSGVAVLVQAMVDADSAGVAFSAEPVTGDRTTAVVTAVRGLAERLVSGEAVPDEWHVRDDRTVRRSGDENAIDAEQAREIAALARRVEREFGVPQDIEWAIRGDRLYLLQARPMTALAATVDWTPPFTAWWLRNLRLGELLPEPVTPLFVDWLLALLERGHARATEEDMGIAVEPTRAVLNGWYYTTPQGRGSPLGLLVRAARRPWALGRFYLLLIAPLRDPRRADGLLSRFATRWREERQPRYESAIRRAEDGVDAMSVAELANAIDEIGTRAGEVMWSVESVAGSAWKIEGAFARFVRTHIGGPIADAYQKMLIGLPGAEPDLAKHAVTSADWYWPTAGETGAAPPVPETLQRHRLLGAEGDQLAERCRAQLATHPARLREFDALLALARRYAVLREEQTRAFTVGWPLLRRAVLGLGTMAAHAKVIQRPEDAFFCTREEILGAARDGGPDLAAQIARRRGLWEEQRRLVAPLEIGTPPALARMTIEGVVASARAAAPVSGAALTGHPASPGRATGRVRVIAGPDDFERFEAGEVLVARATAPAWTPLFARAAAVVTDGGSLAAHASLVAREFGIPAVVATGDATHRLRSGQLVTVDGGAGIVEVVERATSVVMKRKGSFHVEGP